MWADFLSHFSEIGLVEGAENYQVIKQKPPVGEDDGKPNEVDAEEQVPVSFESQLADDQAAVNEMETKLNA